MVNEERWLRNYNLAKKYYEKHENLLIPKSYVVFDEKGNRVNLGRWIIVQRQTYKGNSSSKLNEKQIKLLEEIEMVWEVRNNEEIIPPKWMKNYNLAKKYYEEHGNLLMPNSYVIFDKNSNLVKLGNWVNRQRQAYKGTCDCRLNEKQIEILEEIEMVWEVKYNEEIIPPKWMKHYNLAKKYYEEHGNLLMPARYVVFDEKGNRVNLGLWIYAQRQICKGNYSGKLNEKQIELLEEIEMVWNVKEYQSIISKIERNFLYYQLGMLDQRNVEALLENKMLVYSDDKKIEKGNAIILARKKVS